jgi:hypothetical protein
MSGSKARLFGALAATLALIGQPAAAQPRDPLNPTCPPEPAWGDSEPMRFEVRQVGEERVMIAEGRIEENTPELLQEALAAAGPLAEIWLRSPGGDARAGNQAGHIIRASGAATRIPNGWACFSACNFMFMGGAVRTIDPGGLFIVHMFTHTANRDAVRAEVGAGGERAVGYIADLEQRSALLASEDNDFLIRMGVSRRFLTEVMYQQQAVATRDNQSTRRCLTLQEAVSYRVDNATELPQ